MRTGASTSSSRSSTRALEPYRLRWYEGPGDPLDCNLHSQVAQAYEPPIATGENLFSVQDVRNLARYEGLRPDRDVVEMDPALSYGLIEFLRMLEVLNGSGVCRWGRQGC
jgi:D(-)-tartrate dehydratase